MDISNSVLFIQFMATSARIIFLKVLWGTILYVLAAGVRGIIMFTSTSLFNHQAFLCLVSMLKHVGSVLFACAAGVDKHAHMHYIIDRPQLH